MHNSHATLPDPTEAAAPAPSVTLSVAIVGRAGAAAASKISPAADELGQRRASNGGSLVSRLRSGSITRRTADEADALRLHFRNANQDAIVPSGAGVALADRP